MVTQMYLTLVDQEYRNWPFGGHTRWHKEQISRIIYLPGYTHGQEGV